MFSGVNGPLTAPISGYLRLGSVVLLTFRDDTWVHEGGQGEIGQDEKGDDPLRRWHPWVLPDVELRPAKSRMFTFGPRRSENCHLREVEEQSRGYDEDGPRKSRRYVPRLHIALGHSVARTRL